MATDKSRATVRKMGAEREEPVMMRLALEKLRHGGDCKRQVDGDLGGNYRAVTDLRLEYAQGVYSNRKGKAKRYRMRGRRGTKHGKIHANQVL